MYFFYLFLGNPILKKILVEKSFFYFVECKNNNSYVNTWETLKLIWNWKGKHANVPFNYLNIYLKS